MRLLKLDCDGTLNITHHRGDNTPPYAILSHTWAADEKEVTFSDIAEGSGMTKIGYNKITFCGAQAARDGLQFFWVDTCCIDKSNSTELSEAINSMFRWYSRAAKCYVYLSDVSVYDSSTNEPYSQLTWEKTFRTSRWFTRGWTLLELIAPISLDFFSREGVRLGDKKSLEQQIHEITGITVKCLRGDPLSSFSVQERMLWVAGRQTTIEEDIAYCLLGLFDIYMPLIYGEGSKHACRRLDEEIKKSLKRRDVRMGGGHISGIIGTTAFDQVGTQESPKLTEVERNTGSQNTKYWSDSDYARSSSEYWDQMKGLLSRFYLDENKSLGEVMDLMRSIYGFNAGRAQYERKFKEWGLRKNLKRSDWTIISHFIEHRKRSGKSAVVYLNGTLVPDKKLRKEILRFTKTLPHPESDFVLPEGVAVKTPPRQLSPALGTTHFQNIPWFKFQDAMTLIENNASTNGTTIQPLFVSSKHHLIRPVDIATFTQSILASSILNEISATAAPTLQSIYSYIRALIPERYPRDLLSAAEKIFSPSIKEVLQGFLDILILLCSNNFISDQQTYQAASLAFAGGVESRLLSIFSITTPTVTEFANHLFRGALEAEDLDMVRLMIHGPSHSNPSSTLPKRGKTALEFAVARGNIELAKILLEAGASPNDYMQSEYEGRSESREATIRQDLKGNEDSTEDAKKNLARTVRRKGHTYVNPDRFDGSERSSKDYISIARSAAPLDTVEPEDLQGVLIGSSEAKSAGTALQIATKAGSLDIIQLLLDHGADINASPAAQEGMTALQAASRAGSLDVVRRLLEAGADVNASPALHSGMTALQAASRAGSLDIVQLLLDHGADINASPAAQEGMTALQAASRAGSLDVVRCLLEVGADLRSAAESHLGITALQIAVESGNIGIVETLLDAAAQVYNPLEPEYGGVLLRAAASHGYVSIILLLLDDVMSREADIVLPCLETAIEAAAERGRLDMVHLLYSLYKGKYGGGAKFKMAGTLAMRNGHYAVAKLLSTDNMDEC